MDSDAAVKGQNPLEDTMEKLKIDPSQEISNLNVIGSKDASSSDATSCISSVDAVSNMKESKANHNALESDQGMYYYGYYYPGYNAFFGEWDAQNFFMGPGGIEVQQPVGKAENGSLVYWFPGIQAGYFPYTSVLPGTTIDGDGQYMAHQLHNPIQISPQPLASSGLYPQHFAYATQLVPQYPLDPSYVFPGGPQGNTTNVYSKDPRSKTRFSSQHQKMSSKASMTSLGASELNGSAPVSAVSTNSAQDHSDKPVNKAKTIVLSNGYHPINKLPSLSNHGKNGLRYRNNPTNMLDGSYNWSANEKLKPGDKLSGQSDVTLLNEQNRGPRKNVSKSSSESEASLAERPNVRKDGGGSESVAIIKKNEYNHPDFVTKYEHAYFFVIKSFSEDDIHKSIKYNVWTSTPNGNKRLDSAFHAAQEKIAGNGSQCPVFLFFSVNASGQFCGVAEMVGKVDFSKNMNFWQQDKWSGCFPVKWHLIKDIPNPVLRHIILENNDNKPVTNSRDTQEVKFPQGTEMLNIFKNYSSKTSILDDFSFYEERQKMMQEKRKKLSSNLLHLLPKIPSEVILSANVMTVRR